LKAVPHLARGAVDVEDLLRSSAGSSAGVALSTTVDKAVPAKAKQARIENFMLDGIAMPLWTSNL
jgi:hypothetical protein